MTWLWPAIVLLTVVLLLATSELVRWEERVTDVDEPVLGRWYRERQERRAL